MALTAEQQAQVEYDKESQKGHQKLDLIRLSKEILLENDRIKPVEERGISAEQVIAFADELYAYISQ